MRPKKQGRRKSWTGSSNSWRRRWIRQKVEGRPPLTRPRHQLKFTPWTRHRAQVAFLRCGRRVANYRDLGRLAKLLDALLAHLVPVDARGLLPIGMASQFCHLGFRKCFGDATHCHDELFFYFLGHPHACSVVVPLCVEGEEESPRKQAKHPGASSRN